MKLRIAIAAALGTFLLAAPAHAEIKSIWGGTQLADGRSAFPAYKRLGVDMLQMQLVWSRVATSRPADPRNPDDPAYHWPQLVDAAYAQTHLAHMRLGLLVRGTPGWANDGKTENWAPDRLADYSDFLAAAAKRYSRVRHWMIWGEPTRQAQFEPLTPGLPLGPSLYSRLVDKSYGVLKKIRRSNKVIGGMTFTGGDVSPVEFVRLMTLPNGKPPRLDWFGHNPFTARYPNLRKKPVNPSLRDISDIDTYYQEIRAHWRSRHYAPRLWLSEFCVPSDRRTTVFNFHVSRKAQGRWLSAAFRIAHRSRYVAGIGWFKIQDDQNYCGLLDVNGRKKPAYRAYKRAR